MKLFEIASEHDPNLFFVHSGKDILPAIKFSLMCDYLEVDIEVKQGFSVEQTDADQDAIITIARKIIKHKPGRLGSSLVHFGLDDLAKLKKFLETLDEYFRPSEWRWVCTVTREDEV
jgi:hypothetical protein